MPTRDEPVYLRVESEHILGTLIIAGDADPRRTVRSRLGRRPAAVSRACARTFGAGLRLPHFRPSRSRADQGAVRDGLAQGRSARHHRRVRLPRRAAQRRRRFDRGRRKQLRRLPGGAAHCAAAGEMAGASRARALQGFRLGPAEAAAEGRAAPRALSAPGGASGREPRASGLHDLRRRCPRRRVGAGYGRPAPGHRQLSRSVRERPIAHLSRDPGRRPRADRRAPVSGPTRRCSSLGSPRWSSAPRPAEAALPPGSASAGRYNRPINSRMIRTTTTRPAIPLG